MLSKFPSYVQWQCSHSPEAKIKIFLWIFGKPTIRTKKCDIGFVGKLESSVERVRILTIFDIGMIDHLRQACGNLVGETIPEKNINQKDDNST